MFGLVWDCRRVAGILLALMCLTVPLPGQFQPSTKEEAKPPWQRLLAGQDARKAQQLQEKAGRAMVEDRFADAAEAAGQLLDLRQRVQGKDHWETIETRVHLETFRKLADLPVGGRKAFLQSIRLEQQAGELEGKGQYQRAEPLRQECLDIVGKLLGDDHPVTAKGYNNLAEVHKFLGKYDLAEKGFAKALDIASIALGDNHPNTATSYTNLADVHRAQGKYELAEKGHAKALDIFRKTLGDDHLRTALSHNNLALVHEAQGKYDLAEKGFTKALNIHRQALGEDHPDTAASYNNLADVHETQGKYDLAEKGFTKALDIFRKLLGDDHPYTAASYNNLASVDRAQGKYELAEKGFAKALDITRKARGDDHPNTGASYNNLATVYGDQGKYDLAEKGHAKALDIFRKTWGDEHPATATCYDSLALVHRLQGKYDLAEKGHAKALDIRRTTLGDFHPATGTSYYNLANVHESQGKYELAGKGFAKALDIHRKALGEDHSITASSYRGLALMSMIQGKYKLAEKDLRKALNIFRKALGNDHHTTATCYHNLAGVFLAQANYDQAERNLRQAADSFNIARLRSAGAALDRACFTTELSPLPRLAVVLARNGKPTEAWQRFEQSLAPSTRDELEARLRLSGPDRQRLRQLTARLGSLDRLLEPAAAQANRPTPSEEQRKLWLEERLRARDELAELVRNVERAGGVSLPLNQVQQALLADVALVAWIDLGGPRGAPAALQEHWAVIVRAKGQPAWVRLKGTGPDGNWTEADSRALSDLHQAVQSGLQPDARDWQELAGRVARQRLEPLRPFLKAGADLPVVRHLVVLPSDWMDGIPLEVLTSDYMISTAPSASLFAQLRLKKNPTSKGALALADPVFDPVKLPDLPSHGLLITLVVPRSNAQQFGLQAGDVLLDYDGKPLKGVTDLKLLPPGDDPDARVAVQVWRDGKTFTRRVRPGSLGVALDNKLAPEALAERRRIRKETLALTRGKDDWPALPGTRVEAEALRRLFETRREPVELLTDSLASEQQLHKLAADGKLAGFRFLHLATHGEMNPKLSLQSALILAQDTLPDDAETYRRLTTGEPIFDGRLTAREVLEGWQLDADLVVLSACESGLGKYESGEGFMGFAQAFLIVGSRSVLLSRWKVDDTATALLMSRFYRNLLGTPDGKAKPMTKRAALTEAQKWLRGLSREEALRLAADLTKGVVRAKGRPALPEKAEVPATKGEDKPFAHPYYWAAFALIGDPD
jgi:tetratricopeptide (TPR) repeat protein